MEGLTVVTRVLAHYPADCQPQAIESLGSVGGFSGADFWRLAAAGGKLLCLRRWPPEHPSPERLRFIHSVLRHVSLEFRPQPVIESPDQLPAKAGSPALPVPIATRNGKTFVSAAGTLWELTPWLPGIADFHANPSAPRLSAALAALARFHLASSTFPHPEPKAGHSPAMLERSQMIGGLLRGGYERVGSTVGACEWPEFAIRARRLLTLFPRLAPRVSAELEVAAQLRVPLQPCIRDIWHDHVLFEGDEVSGLIDFGAMRIETVAGDVARLLGSLIGDDPASWQAGLAAYSGIRPLSNDEQRLISAFDRSTVLLSGMNWLTWICVDKRTFADRPRILARLDETLARLEHAATSGPLVEI